MWRSFQFTRARTVFLDSPATPAMDATTKEAMKEEVARGEASVLARARYFQREIESVVHTPPSASRGSVSTPSQPMRAPPPATPPTLSVPSTPVVRESSHTTPVAAGALASTGDLAAFVAPVAPAASTLSSPAPPSGSSGGGGGGGSGSPLTSGVSERRHFFMHEASKLRSEEEAAEVVKNEAARRRAVREAERNAYERAEREALEKLQAAREATAARVRDLQERQARRAALEERWARKGKFAKFTEGGGVVGGEEDATARPQQPPRPAWR